MSTEEICFLCGDATGRAGRAEDSLYNDAGSGPFCESCFADSGCNTCHGSGFIDVKRNNRGELDYIDGSRTGEQAECQRCHGEGYVQ